MINNGDSNENGAGNGNFDKERHRDDEYYDETTKENIKDWWLGFRVLESWEIFCMIFVEERERVAVIDSNIWNTHIDWGVFGLCTMNRT